jgi:16S rRNA (guanine527-N7)-methyltransferase
MNAGAQWDEAAVRAHVSRETGDKLALLAAELQRWQAIKNLVSSSTLDEVWSRHIADSLQLADLEPQAPVWLDLGSGAGFPGLVVALAIANRPAAHVHLVESNGRKCAFLRHAVRITGAPATVHEARVEAVAGGLAGKVDVVTARAVASLTQLLGWSQDLLKSGAAGLFPKGRNTPEELTEAEKSWRFKAELLPSRTDSEARIVRVTSFEGPRPPDDR